MLDGDWYSYCNTGMVSMCWEMCVRSWMDGYGRERGRPFMDMYKCMYILWCVCLWMEKPKMVKTY